MTTYAKGTTVAVEDTKRDIERLLSRNGAEQYGTVTDTIAGTARIAFVIDGAKFRIDVPLPKQSEFTSCYGKSSGERWQQACRERWRAMLLLLKAKLELVKLGISTIDREFMADMVLPNGSTASEFLGHVIRNGLADPGVDMTRLLGSGGP